MAVVRNLIFDLGGVLLNLDMDKTTAAFVNIGFTDFAGQFGIGYADSFFKAYETGSISDAAFLEELKKRCDASCSEATVKAAWNAMLADFPPERIDLLNRLKDNYRLFLFSNTNGIHLEAFQEIYHQAFSGKLDDHFEKAYYSNLAGVRKPDAAAYQLVLDENGLEAADTLFIDDALVNVEAARAVGLQGAHVAPGMTILDLGLE